MPAPREAGRVQNAPGLADHVVPERVPGWVQSDKRTTAPIDLRIADRREPQDSQRLRAVDLVLRRLRWPAVARIGEGYMIEQAGRNCPVVRQTRVLAEYSLERDRPQRSTQYSLAGIENAAVIGQGTAFIVEGPYPGQLVLGADDVVALD